MDFDPTKSSKPTARLLVFLNDYLQHSLKIWLVKTQKINAQLMIREEKARSRGLRAAH